MELRHTATRAGRLSTFLKNEMGMSTGLVNKLKWQNKILVNGTPQHNDFSVAAGDVITALLDDPAPQYPAEEGPLTILYEDDHILAVDKPAGMLIHPSRSCMTGTLANRVIAYYKRTNQACAFHPVTRLDRDTFGIVLLAKNAHVHALLNQLHNDGKLKKCYTATVFGSPKNDCGIIDAPIQRRPLPSLLRYVNQSGKPSQTEFQVLSRAEKTAKLWLRPITGRTHQLRVHCAYMGFPILGDPQYGSQESIAFSQSMGLTSQLLCARELTFPHPITGAEMRLTSHLDANFPALPNRLPDYDYSATGAYFITICTKDRKNLFWDNVASTDALAYGSVGAIIDRPQNAPLTPLGQIVDRTILDIPKHYPSVSVDHYVVMPNHIHLLLQIQTDNDGRSMIAPTISTVVRLLKWNVSKAAGFSVWQKSFHDHVVRNDVDYREIWQYIENNPQKWMLDKYHIDE